ncbi:MAG: ABC transporter permease [Bacteroidales bacterium]
MRTILFLIQKEFIQVFRNKTMLPIIFALPVLQLLILANAATFEMQSIKLVVVDSDNSTRSRELIHTFEGSSFYQIVAYEEDVDHAFDYLMDNSADAVLTIAHDFERTLLREDKGEVQLLVNAINGTAAGLINAYTSGIIADFNRKILLEMVTPDQLSNMKTVQVERSFWYNPDLDYKVYMVPGILVILVTMVSMFLAALNIVREKEIGTIEQVNVSPIGKFQFIVGKLTPFLLIGLFELAFGLAIGWLFFDVPIRGSLGVLFVFATLYLIVVLGIGLFMSTIAQTQQQVMFINFFFMLVFILMSGIFTPTESMPEWAQRVNIINPLAYFMRVIRMIMLKASSMEHILPEVRNLSAYAVVILSLATWRYRKTT